MAKLRHVVEGSYYSASTERREVYALCGYSEEASGSGRHAVDKSEEDCPKCAELDRRLPIDPRDSAFDL